MAMTYSYDDLINNPVWGANKIKNARNENENTALRVGTFLANLALYAKETLDRTGNTVLADSLRQFFLSKDRDDLTLFNLAIKTLVIGLSARSDGFEEGLHGAGIFRKDGKWIGEFDNLVVHDKIEATTIEIDHEKHVGGRIVASAADMIITDVEEVKNSSNVVTGYKCYFDSVDKNGKEVKNKWVVNDQALCREFSVSVNQQSIVSKYYWRLVTEAGFDIETNRNYVILSNTNQGISGGYVGSDIPAVNDEVVQLGYRGNASRNGALLLAAVGSYSEDVPSFIIYKGIQTFQLNSSAMKIKLSPQEIYILASAIKLEAGGDVESALQTIEGKIRGFEDGKFEFHQDEVHTMPLDDDDETISVLLDDDFDWLPSADWETDTEREQHVGDELILKDGVSYEYREIDGEYGWHINADPYLIEYVRQMKSVADLVDSLTEDNVISKDEKIAVQKMYDEIDAQSDQLYLDYNSLEATEYYYKDKVTSWEDYTDALSDLIGQDGYLTQILESDEALVLGDDTFTRTELMDAISTYYRLYAAVLSEMQAARLLSTGIDILSKTIRLTADNIVCRNNKGERTAYINDAGDINIKGIVNKNAIVIDDSTADKFLIPFCNDDFCGASDWSTYVSNPNIGTRTYGDNVVTTFNPFDSHDYLGFASAVTENSHSLDVLRIDGIVTLESGLLEDDWFTEQDGQTFKNLIVLPYMRFNGSTGEGTNTEYLFQALRTPTRNDTGELHLITVDEMRSLVGKRITFCNNSGTNMWINGFVGMTIYEAYVTGTVDGETASESDVTTAEKYANDGMFIQIPVGTSVTIEFKELTRDFGQSTVSDIVPLVISQSNYGQQFSKDVITLQPTFGDDVYPANDNE